MKDFMEILSLIGGILFGFLLFLAPVITLCRFICKRHRDKRAGRTESCEKVSYAGIAMLSALFSYGIYVVAGSINYYVDVNTAPEISSVTADIMSVCVYIFVVVCALAMLGAGIYRKVSCRALDREKL